MLFVKNSAICCGKKIKTEVIIAIIMTVMVFVKAWNGRAINVQNAGLNANQLSNYAKINLLGQD